MKLLLGLSLFFSAIHCAQAFKIPETTHHIGQLETAQMKAAKKKLPLSFLITDKKFIPT